MTQKPPISFRPQKDIEDALDKAIQSYSKQDRKPNWLIGKWVKEGLIREKFLKPKPKQ